MAGSVKANKNFYDQVVTLMRVSDLSSTDAVRVLTALLIGLHPVSKTPS